MPDLPPKIVELPDHSLRQAERRTEAPDFCRSCPNCQPDSGGRLDSSLGVLLCLEPEFEDRAAQIFLNEKIDCVYYVSLIFNLFGFGSGKNANRSEQTVKNSEYAKICCL